MNTTTTTYDSRLPTYTKKEESVHVASHALGVILGFIVIIYTSINYREISQLTSGIIFGLSLVILYTISCVYHGCLIRILGSVGEFSSIKEAAAFDKPEPVEETPVEPVEGVEPVVAPVVPAALEDRIIYDYSFMSRLHLNDADTDERYNELKNHLLSYEGMSSNMSWKQETFVYKGKMVAKLRLQGKTLKVFLSVDPKSLDSKYRVEDKSDTKSLSSTPTLQIVKGPRQLAHAMQLVDLAMGELEGQKLEDYKPQKFTVKKMKRETLIEMNLIKVQNGEFTNKD